MNGTVYAGDATDTVYADYATDHAIARKRSGSGRQRKVTDWRAPDDAPWSVPGTTHAARVIAFIERYLTLPTDTGERIPVRLRAWQKRAIRRIYGPEHLPNRAAMLSISRGNGKSRLAAMLAVAELFLVYGAEVLCCAYTERQATEKVYKPAADMIEASPVLSAHAIVYANRSDPYTLLPGRGSSMRPLPAEERALQSWGPTLAVVDEIGFTAEGVWHAMVTGSGKRARSMILGIGSPGYDKGVMYAWREMALGKDPPPRFEYIEIAADPGCDIRDRRQQRKANPALGDFLATDQMELLARTIPEAKFRTLHLGQWTEKADQFIGTDAWDALVRDPSPLPSGSSIVLGFDGSVAIDSTGLVALDLATNRLHVLALWERPRGDRRWRVPRSEVRAAIDAAFQTHRVVRMHADPYYFRDMLEELADQYGEDRVLIFNTSSKARMAVATDRFETSVAARTVSWDGHEALRRHVLAAVAEVTPAGPVVRKRADKPVPIDLAVCSILAVDAAAAVEMPSYAAY